MSAFQNVGPTIESAASLMAAHEASMPAPAAEPAVEHSDQVFAEGAGAFDNSFVPEPSAEVAPPEVPSPQSSPAPVPPSPVVPDWQAAMAQMQQQTAQERAEFLRVLQSFAPKQEAQPEVEPDYLALLPHEMRHEANLPTAKAMWQIAQNQINAVRQELAKKEEAQRFQNEVQQASYSAAQAVQRFSQRGYDLTVPGAEKLKAGAENFLKAKAARFGGDPAQYENELAEFVDAAVRSRLAHQTAQNRQRQQLQAPAARVPAMTGAPGAAPSQLPGAGAPAVPSEAEARAKGYASLTDWYVKNR